MARHTTAPREELAPVPVQANQPAAEARPTRTGAAQAARRLQRAHGNRFVARLAAYTRVLAAEAEASPPAPESDPFERAADAAAAHIARQADAGPRPAPPTETPAGLPVPPEFAAGIKAAGGGRPLPAELRATMEGVLGADLAGVRIHADAHADGLNRALGARAFTTGRAIFFRQGEYRPESGDGRELLAHELAHVAQQSAGAAPEGAVVQARLKYDRAWLEEKAGGGFGRSREYRRILKWLGRYDKLQRAQPGTRSKDGETGILTSLLAACNAWLELKGGGALESETVRRKVRITALRDNVASELEVLGATSETESAEDETIASDEEWLDEEGVPIKRPNLIGFPEDDEEAREEPSDLKAEPPQVQQSELQRAVFAKAITGAKKRSAGAEKALQRRAQELGLTPEELDLLRAAVRAAEVTVNFEPNKVINEETGENVAEAMQKSGKYLNRFEVGRSGGSSDFKGREQVEREMFDYPEITEASPLSEKAERPRYAAINPEYAALGAAGGSSYGNSALVFKEHVKQAATIIHSDSFGGAHRKDVGTFEYLDHVLLERLKEDNEGKWARAVLAQGTGSRGATGDIGWYMEVHLHSDIDFARDVVYIRAALPEAFGTRAGQTLRTMAGKDRPLVWNDGRNKDQMIIDPAPDHPLRALFDLFWIEADMLRAEYFLRNNTDSGSGSSKAFKALWPRLLAAVPPASLFVSDAARDTAPQYQGTNENRKYRVISPQSDVSESEDESTNAIDRAPKDPSLYQVVTETDARYTRGELGALADDLIVPKLAQHKEALDADTQKELLGLLQDLKQDQDAVGLRRAFEQLLTERELI